MGVLAAIVLLSAAAVTAEPGGRSQGADADAQRRAASAASAACRHLLGEWADAAGETYGERAYAARHLEPARKPVVAVFDVTALAREWLVGTRSNDGLFLRATGGAGSVLFHGREGAEPQVQPALELQWSDGSTARLAPVSETFLDCGADRTFEPGRILKVGRDQTAFLVFDLPAAHGRTLARASLRLQVFRQHARRLAVGVFRPTPAWAEAARGAQRGLAEDHPGDAGIADDPRVVLALSFEDEEWKAGWTRLSREGSAEIVLEDAVNGFVPLAGKALKTTLKKGANTALNLRYAFRQQTGQEPEALYFRYYLRFGDDWHPDLDGGKLPGFAGTYGVAGWGMRRSDGTNGWSLRGAFSTVAASASGGIAIPVGTYAYHADMKGHSGELWRWKRGPGALLRNSRWYAIEQYVKLNTPGERDGLFKAWVDGELVYERVGLGLRDLDTIRIESVWLNVFHGGTRRAPRDMSLYIDNLVVASHYIGPMVAR